MCKDSTKNKNAKYDMVFAWNSRSIYDGDIYKCYVSSCTTKGKKFPTIEVSGKKYECKEEGKEF